MRPNNFAPAFRSNEAQFKAGAWLKTFFKAANEGTNTAGGAIAPSELETAILTRREAYGVFRKNARVIPMRSDTKSAPRRTAGVTATWIGENIAVPESQPNFDAVSLVAKKLATLTRYSSELAEDSEPNIAEAIADEIAYAFAVAEDGAGWNGDGSSAYASIRGLTFLATDGAHNAAKVTATVGHNTFGTLDGTDIGALIAALPKFALPGAKLFISNFGYGATLCRLAGTNGGLVATIGPDGQLSANYNGFPVVICQSLPQISGSLSGKVMAAFGDLSLAATLGERRQISLNTSNDRYLEFDQIAIVGTERVDIVNHDLGDNTTAGPMVFLVGA